MHEKLVRVSPFVIRLDRIDPWYWCRYFIDVGADCPYGCGYCNTQRRSSLHARGLTVARGLPEDHETIGLGLISDFYSPEPDHNRITGEVLRILLDGGYAVNVLTKSAAVLHDVDLLRRFALHDRVRVTVTILSLDDHRASQIEGCAPPPNDRLDVVRSLNDAGVPTGIAVTPIIPFVTDDVRELARLVSEAKRDGAAWVLFSGLDPVPSFMENPCMRTVRSRYDDEEILNSRYRTIKRSMVDLLQGHGISMRVPRMKGNPGDAGFHNRMVSEFLFNISYLYELNGSPLQSKRYERAAASIEGLDSPIKPIVFRNDLGYIRGINPDIEQVIRDILTSGGSTLCEELQDRLTGVTRYG